MSDIEKSGDTLAQAADWHARLRADDTGAQDFRAFETWVSDPQNRAAYDQIDLAWAEAGDHEIAFADFSPQATRRSWTLPATLIAAAAAIVLVFIGLSPVHWTTFQGSPDATRSIQLADGSTITLNRRARADVAFDSQSRRVRLVGEAAFDVRHDPSRPFTIDADGQQIRVVGTEFNVLDDHGALSVTVRRGIVQVGPRAGRATVFLHVNETGLHRAGSTAWNVVPGDPDAALSWRTGRLVYRDATLAGVVADLNRYYDKPMRLGDQSLAQERFSGTLKIGSQQEAIQLLELFLPLSVSSTDAEVVLHRRER